MRTCARPGRTGFTLVELLVVISLIAILLALSAGAFFRIQSSQNVSTAEATLTKLHSLMDSKWKITLDDARKTVPQSLVDSFGGDKERAQIAWTYAKLKNEMPMTFSEVYNEAGTTPLPYKPNDVVTAIYLLPAFPTVLVERKVYQNVAAQAKAKLAALVPPKTLSAVPFEMQSAALFYAMVTQTASGGTMNSLEGLQQQVTTDSTTGLTFFIDAWGKPIAFVRHARNTEIDSNYTKPNLVQILPSPALKTKVFTSLDNSGKMIEDNPWRSANNLALQSGVIDSLNANVPPVYWVDLKNRNQLPTLVSSGPNTDFLDPDSAQPDKSQINIADPFATGAANDDNGDNLLSYRLRTVGARGN